MIVEEFRMPAGPSETEFVEKRSRFIGHVWPIMDEEEAREYIEQTKKRYHDARHNCWCYRLSEKNVERFSDDGEPQGTAGQPILSVFRKQGITNVCCVVTRYFGGVLLGTGGLVRAYTQSAMDSIEAAGITVMRPWVRLSLRCPYQMFEQAKLKLSSMGGILERCDYAEDVTMSVLVPEESADGFSTAVADMTSGKCCPAGQETVWRAAMN